MIKTKMLNKLAMKRLNKVISPLLVWLCCSFQVSIGSASGQSNTAAPPALPSSQLTIIAAAPDSAEEMVLSTLVEALKSAYGFAADQLTLHVGAPIQALRKGQVIEVAFRDMRLLDDNGNGIYFGDFTYTALPEQDDSFSYQLAMSNEWIIVDSGTPLLRAVLGDHRCRGSYWRRLSIATDCLIDQIIIKPLPNIAMLSELSLTIDSLQFVQSMTPHDEIVDGSSNLIASDIRFNSGTGQQVNIESITSATTLEQFSLPILLSLMQRVSALTDTQIVTAHGAVEQTLVLNYLLDLLQGAATASALSASRIAGLTYINAGVVIASAAEIGGLGGYKGIDTLSDLRGDFHFKQLRLALPQFPVALQPLSLTVDMTIAGLPLMRFAQSLATITPIDARDQPLVAQLLHKIILQDPPMVKIDRIQIAGGQFEMQLSGQIRPWLAADTDLTTMIASAQSPLDFLAADLSGTIHGLDFLTGQLAQSALTQPDLLELVLATSLIKGFGEAIGQDQYAYALQFSPEQGLFLNGKDMTLLLPAIE